MVGMCTPGRTRTYSVACAAVRVIRGSMTIMLARLSSLPSRMCCSDTGCASAGLPPMTTIVFLGVADIVVAVGHRAVAPGVGHAGDRGRMADARLMVDVVGSPERPELAIEIGRFIGEFGGTQPVDGVRARFRADLQQFVADLVDRLIPRESRS